MTLLVTQFARAGVDQPPAVPVPPLGVMRKALLEDGRPYEVAIGALPTTILMPAPIEAFEGNNFTTVPNTAAAVFLQHEPGTRFFSVKSLLAGTADLNVVIGDSVYSFRFYLSDNPTRTLTIAAPPVSQPASRVVRTTARRLYDILQDAKTYFAIKEQHPQFERTIEVTAPGKVCEYSGYRLVIDQVFRFDRDDTLVFRVVFLNDAAVPRFYRPSDLGLRVGQNLYWPSFAQVPQVIPARTPARLTWDVSPDVQRLEIRNPQGQTASLLGQLAAPLPEVGNYVVVAQDKDGRTDTVKFTVKFPVPANEPNPLVVAKDVHDFGLRRLEVVQPEAGQNFGYVCYTGTADGRRADLSLKNEFTLLLPTRVTP